MAWWIHADLMEIYDYLRLNDLSDYTSPTDAKTAAGEICNL